MSNEGLSSVWWLFNSSLVTAGLWVEQVSSGVRPYPSYRGSVSLHCVPSSRRFRGECAATYLSQDPAAPVNEDYAWDHVQTGSALCPLCAADGASAKPGGCSPSCRMGEMNANTAWSMECQVYLHQAVSAWHSPAQQVYALFTSL